MLSLTVLIRNEDGTTATYSREGEDRAVFLRDLIEEHPIDFMDAAVIEFKVTAKDLCKMAQYEIANKLEGVQISPELPEMVSSVLRMFIYKQQALGRDVRPLLKYDLNTDTSTGDWKVVFTAVEVEDE